ncbi:hypothetical protein SAMN04490220_1151 [Rhodococcus jostii]|uniref:Uncharacterized protein n=2 Tax=Rhodococcus jostii TaxID=132919 RepID=A0A1H4QY54_RHOJO|nr:hypothetical protein SAMN04490220_1151 [Rhodococcus jostii]
MADPPRSDKSPRRERHSGNGITREAERHLVPWLKLACETLDSPMSIDGLEDVAAQWRERRRPYMLAAADQADVIIVDPIPRLPATLWWKLVHGDEPPPPL